MLQYTNAVHGALSNFHPSRIRVEGGHLFRTPEALYQALKHPHDPDRQRAIQNAKTPKEAKRMGRCGRLREDWDRVKIPAMKWTLALRYQQDGTFREALAATGDLPVVERSRTDDFWGAVPQPDGTLRGTNALGRILELMRNMTHEGRELIPPHPGTGPLRFVLRETSQPTSPETLAGSTIWSLRP